jgi:hypothetical protein
MLIQFLYDGPTSGPNPTEEASRVLDKAESAVERKLNENNIQFRHAYSWPDRSLYKYVKTEKTVEELNNIFIGNFLRFDDLAVDHMIYFMGKETLIENYFLEKYPKGV